MAAQLQAALRNSRTHLPDPGKVAIVGTVAAVDGDQVEVRVGQLTRTPKPGTTQTLFATPDTPCAGRLVTITRTARTHLVGTVHTGEVIVAGLAGRETGCGDPPADLIEPIPWPPLPLPIPIPVSPRPTPSPTATASTGRQAGDCVQNLAPQDVISAAIGQLAPSPPGGGGTLLTEAGNVGLQGIDRQVSESLLCQDEHDCPLTVDISVHVVVVGTMQWNWPFRVDESGGTVRIDRPLPSTFPVQSNSFTLDVGAATEAQLDVKSACAGTFAIPKVTLGYELKTTSSGPAPAAGQRDLLTAGGGINQCTELDKIEIPGPGAGEEATLGSVAAAISICDTAELTGAPVTAHLGTRGVSFNDRNTGVGYGQGEALHDFGYQPTVKPAIAVCIAPEINNGALPDPPAAVSVGKACPYGLAPANATALTQPNGSWNPASIPLLATPGQLTTCPPDSVFTQALGQLGAGVASGVSGFKVKKCWTDWVIMLPNPSGQWGEGGPAVFHRNGDQLTFVMVPNNGAEPIDQIQDCDRLRSLGVPDDLLRAENCPVGVAVPTGATVKAPTCDQGSLTYEYQPARIVIGCGKEWLDGLHWTSWTTQTATGTGVMHANDCTPDCARGQFHSYAADITLEAPKPAAASTYYFATIEIRYPNGGPDGVRIDVFNR